MTLKVIFIAGNEPFTQGYVDYRASCRAADHPEHHRQHHPLRVGCRRDGGKLERRRPAGRWPGT